MNDDELMQDEEALLPCPFCGGEAEQIEVEPQAFCIECTKCQASSKVVYFLMDDGSMLLREAWNDRVHSHGG